MIRGGRSVHYSTWLNKIIVKFHVMMDSLVTNNILSGYKAGRGWNLSISHLQFADDTLILGIRVGLMFRLCTSLFTFSRLCLVWRWIFTRV